LSLAAYFCGFKGIYILGQIQIAKMMQMGLLQNKFLVVSLNKTIYLYFICKAVDQIPRLLAEQPIHNGVVNFFRLCTRSWASFCSFIMRFCCQENPHPAALIFKMTVILSGATEATGGHYKIPSLTRHSREN
jgi:hypothetical protein